MVFERRPEEILNDAIANGLSSLKSAIAGVSTIIRDTNETIQDLDDALTGGASRIIENPQETFLNILDLLHEALEEARENKSAAAPVAVQKAREILNRINTVEPAWRSAPRGLRTLSDVFRAGLRDLRASNALLRVAQGNGKIEDLENLSKWADDLIRRLESFKPSRDVPHIAEKHPKALESPPEITEETPESTEKENKKTRKGEKIPAEAKANFVRCVAEVVGEKKVAGWAEEYASGKISEAQWVSRLSAFCAPKNLDPDEVYDKAAALYREKYGHQA